MPKQEYSAENITILEGLDAVRIRPGMYIGSTGVKGLHHILWEIVDNAIDEAANGHADAITVTLHKDGSASVRDNGRGIPTDLHSKMGISGVEVVFTQLHAGGKFNENNYSFSGGLHGVGASVTNALSEWLKVEVYRDTIHKISFRSYFDKEKDKFMCGIPESRLIDTKEKTKERGTFVHFKPDASVFDSVNFNFETVSKRLKELAFLNKGLAITLVDERVPEDRQPISIHYQFDGGLYDFVVYLNEGKTPLYKEPIGYKVEKEGILIEFVLQHTDEFTESTFSFVNNIPTPEGGYHETGFKAGLTRALNDIARSSGLLKEKESNLMGEDFREGLTAILAIKMKNVQFEGQTKTKLGNAEARAPIETAVLEGLQTLAQDSDLKVVFEQIVKKAQAAAKARLAAKQAKDIARAGKSIENITLVGKLWGCTGKRVELNELFIVEGNSAGGTAKKARMRQTQAILPLRGKPLNVEKKKIEQVLANEEIRTIISALGAGYGSVFSIDDLKYHKVIILADADQDGMHIRCILLTFFYRYMKELITNGNLYIGLPPLYKVYKKDHIEYAYDDNELQEKIEIVGRGYQIQRYKGLGEMSEEQLWETTMDPKRRNLIQVCIEDAIGAERMVTALMGNRVDARKEFLAEKANFNKVDNFINKINI